MIITRHDSGYFKVQSGSTTILIDPTNQRSFRGARIVINTERPTKVEPPKDDDTLFWIDHQGEYEIDGIVVRGWYAEKGAEGERTVYTIVFEGIRIGIIGPVTKLKPEFVEHLRAVDVVMVPVGGKPLLSPKDIAGFVRQIEPAIIIASRYKDAKPFLKEFGEDTCKEEEKIVIKKKDVEQGTMKLMCLKVT